MPTGAVTFIEGLANPPLEIVLGTGTLNVSGVASFTMSALPVGTDTITASYGGNTDFGSSSLTGVSEIVTKRRNVHEVNGLRQPRIVRHTVIFTVTVQHRGPRHWHADGSFLGSSTATRGWARPRWTATWRRLARPI